MWRTKLYDEVICSWYIIEIRSIHTENLEIEFILIREEYLVIFKGYIQFCTNLSTFIIIIFKSWRIKNLLINNIVFGLSSTTGSRAHWLCFVSRSTDQSSTTFLRSNSITHVQNIILSQQNLYERYWNQIKNWKLE